MIVWILLIIFSLIAVTNVVFNIKWKIEDRKMERKANKWMRKKEKRDKQKGSIRDLPGPNPWCSLIGENAPSYSFPLPKMPMNQQYKDISRGSYDECM